MKCDNCGNNNPEGATFCTGCGGRLLAVAAPAVQPAVAPSPPVQPQPQYAPQPPVYQHLPRQPMLPTVRPVHLGDVLFLIASVLLLGTGLANFSNITAYYIGAQYIILGLVAFLGGLFMMALVIMPELLKPVKQYTDLGILAFSGIFLLWGLVATFANNVGYYGGFLLAAGLFSLAGCGLRMGYIK
jgi:hypothetical protein